MPTFLCPECGGLIPLANSSLRCLACGQHFPRVGSIPVILPQPDAHLALWRSQLSLLKSQGQKTHEAFKRAAAAGGLSPRTVKRLESLAEAVGQQAEDIVAVMGPALGGEPAPPSANLPRGVVEYISYLYRDWAWPDEANRENEWAVSQFSSLGGASIGRTLVLGAGACRLAYDLHRRLKASETLVVDIDPYLLVTAQQVIRGKRVPLTEASLKVMEIGGLARRWTLTAPAGALPEEDFQFLLADGLNPPLTSASFDTVVTPWFIDQVPQKLPEFVATLRRLLRPGGRWLNQGPLIYPDSLPFERRYCREELFELLARGGFEIGTWSGDSRPYLVSPLSGAGKIESVLTFIASSTAG